MTEIKVLDRNGKIVFRSIEPRLLTEEQIEQELKDWCVNTAIHTVQVIRKTK